MICSTVWYELLCGEWPFKNQPPEAVIWQVGKGIKQPLANLQASAEVKVNTIDAISVLHSKTPRSIKIQYFRKLHFVLYNALI